MAGLVRILLIFLGIYLVSKVIRRYVLPLLFKKAAEKMQDRMGRTMDPQDTRREGEVRVEKKKGDEDDFVDYEEVE
jgi:hypothetical protein